MYAREVALGRDEGEARKDLERRQMEVMAANVLASVGNAPGNS